MFRKLNFLLVGVFFSSFAFECNAQAIQIQGSADAARIKPEEKIPQLPSKQGKVVMPEAADAQQISAPKGSEELRFTLKEVKIEGMTAFQPDAMLDIYKPYIGKEMAANIIWEIAGRITERYRAEGYFLSRAYVPAQSIKDGTIIIKVSEGYIGDVEVDDAKLNDRSILKKYIENLKQKRPLKSADIESFLLRVNDLPGYSFRAILSALEEANNEPSVKLTLSPAKLENRGTVSFNNNGSRFLGPNQGVLTYEMNIVPLQKTTISISSSFSDEINYGAIRHEAAIAPDLLFNVTGSITKAQPGFSLKPFEIDSTSKFLGLGFEYQIFRQRDMNLKSKLSLDGRSTKSDILSATLVEDEVRALRAGFVFDNTDSFYGANMVDVNLSQGLSIMGASKKGDLNLSRADANPEFTKIEARLSRTQAIENNWSVMVASAGQLASDPLFSSEEFGYGGLDFGRAYDSSELTGDDGIAGTVELRYSKFVSLEPVGLVPYVFYDVGKVWNKDVGGIKDESGSSAGVGTAILLPKNASANVALAYPLTREIDTPIYGQQKSGPRIILQLVSQF